MNILIDSPYRYIDLSLKIGVGVPVYPGDPLFGRKIVATHAEDGFQVTSLTLGTHLGTHLDAPSHAFIDGESIDELPLEFFWGKAAIVNLAPLVALSWQRELPFLLDVPTLLPFESVFRTVERVILRTDWSKQFGNEAYFRSFPSLTIEAARWIARFPLFLLGLETPSLSSLSPEISGQFPAEPLTEEILEADRECHRILLGQSPPILLLEGLTNLETLPTFELNDFSQENQEISDDKLIELCCFPLSLEKGDGSPVRAIARVASSLLKKR